MAINTRALRGTTTFAGFLGAAIACFAPTPAAAQLRDQQTQTYLSGPNYAVSAKNESVRERPREEFDPLGIELDELFGAVGLISREAVEGKTTPLASFNAFPRLNTTGRYESNIYRAEARAKPDRIGILSPGLTIRSDWANHSVELTSSADIGRWTGHPTEDYEDLHNLFRFGIDVTDSLMLSGDFNMDHLHEPRGAIDDPGQGVRPLTYWQPKATLQGRYFADAILLNPAFTVSRLDYDGAIPVVAGGPTVNAHERTFTDTNVNSRFGYEFQPGTIAFILPSATWRNFDQTRADDGTLQDSRIYTVLGGLTWDVSSVTFLDIGVGYLVQDFDEPTFKTVTSPAGFLTGIWNATELLTLTVRAESFTTETTQANISTVLTHRGTFGIDYEISDNLIASWSNVFGINTYEQLDPKRQDTTFSSRLGIDYLIGRNFTTGFGLGWDSQNSNAFDHSFVNRSIEFRLGVRL